MIEVSSFHHVVDVQFSSRYASVVRKRLACWGTPFPLSVSMVLERALLQAPSVLKSSWRDCMETNSALGDGASGGSWTLDLENRELYSAYRMCKRLGCSLQEAIAFGCHLSLAHELACTSATFDEEPGARPPLMVLLDLDGTLLIDRTTYRPGALAFLQRLGTHAQMCLWSASSSGRVWMEAMKLETHGVLIGKVLTIEDTFGPVPYDSRSAKSDFRDGTMGFRKGLGDLVHHQFDPARTVLVDDGLEHWSGQYNSLLCVPSSTPLYSCEDEQLWGALLSHVERLAHCEDVRLAQSFLWEESWIEDGQKVGHMLERERIELV